MATQTPTNAPPTIWRNVRYRWNDAMWAYLFLAPVVIHLLLFKYYPIVNAFRLSLFRGQLLDPFDRFVGLYHYQFLLQSDYFWRGVTNALTYGVLRVPVGAAIALMLALLINQHFRARMIFRVAWYAPVVTSTVAQVQIWLWIYNVEFGLLNNFLNSIGLPGLQWLYHPSTAMISLVIMSWWGVAFQMVIYLAALQGISEEIYEAAAIDGAGAIAKFFRITFPLLMPTTFFVIITQMIQSLMLFEPIYLMTGGGPMNATTMTGYQIYEAAFEFNLWGRASAMSILFFIMVLLFTAVQYKLLPESYQ